MKPEVHPSVYTMQDRLDLIAKRVDASIRTPQKTKDGQQFMLRDLALEVVSGAPQHGQESEKQQIDRVFWWVKNNVEYRQDPADYDMYMTAGRTIAAGGSDCDDHTILNAAMLNSLGFRTGAKVVSPDGANWHIYAVVGAFPFYNPTVIIPMDTTQPGSYPGWEPPIEQRQFGYLVDFEYDQAKRLRKISG
jgi:hypothetical protein